MKRIVLHLMVGQLAVLVGSLLGASASAAAVPEPATAGASASSSARVASLQDIEQARERFSEGLRLYSDSNFKGARAAMQRAYDLAPSYKLLYNIGLCDRELGDFVEGIDALERHLREGGDAIEAARRVEIEKTIASLRERLAHVRVHVSVPDADILVDDKMMGKAVPDPIGVNPGRRLIWASKAGYRAHSKEVFVEAAQDVDVLIELSPLAPPAASGPRALLGSGKGKVGIAVVATLVIATLVLLRLRRRGPAPAAMNLDTPHGVDLPLIEPTPAHVVPIVCDAGASGPTTPSSQPMVLDGAVGSDIGKVKPTNQDSYVVIERHGLYAVADGIGGNAGGGVASAIAVRTLDKMFGGGALAVGQLTHIPRAAGELAAAIYGANRAVRLRQAADWNISEMGTTCVAARFCREEGRLYIAHIGDSRAYRLRDGKLEQLTTDHTMAELGMVGPRASHLSRALGSDPCPKIDVLLAQPVAGDVYVLCSDGLTKMISVEQLAEVLRGSSSARKATAALVKLANAQGGQDNITAIVVRVRRS
jgi:serine/threonine protein phosphatase PrpC